MTTLTTHILDTAHGCPAAGVRIDLSRMEQGRPRLLTTSISNGEGRTDRPLLAGGAERRQLRAPVSRR
jgi:5-hydroxyisourate hydrolase